MNHKKGFTFVEILLALAVLSLTAITFSQQHIRTLRKLVHSRDLVERIFLLKQELYLYFVNPARAEKPIKITSDVPEMKIVATASSINKKSSLYGISKHLYRIESVGRWKERGEEEKQTMISFAYMPQPAKKE